MKPTEINKHTDGIDVPGIWVDNDRVRFVVCEVKASEAVKIPCDSVKELQKDIQKAIDNEDYRVSRDILEYMHGIMDVKIKEDLFNKIVVFLANLIGGEKKDLVNNIVFFPFLLRNNDEIVVDKNVNDYKNFFLDRVGIENVENIILTFKKQFTDFSNEVYENAIGK